MYKHYNNDTKNVFNFLSEFMTNKFYNIVYELSKKYSLKNGLSLSTNYKNIFDSFMDTLIITSKNDEQDKNMNFNLFLNHLYECYKNYSNNQLISINEFITKVNTTFLPENYKNETYIQNKENLSVLFHTLIYTMSKQLYEYILKTPDNIDMVISNRLSGNFLIIQRQCVLILCNIRHDLFEKFKEQDDNIVNFCLENDIIETNPMYIKLKKDNETLKDQLKQVKVAIVKIVKKENYYKEYIEKLHKLIKILSEKEACNTIVEEKSREIVEDKIEETPREVVEEKVEDKYNDLENIFKIEETEEETEEKDNDNNTEIISSIKSDLESLFN